MSGARTVAVLGAGGTMGFGMARNIARAGLPLRAWDRSREKAEPLGEDGARVLDTPAQAAQDAAIVVTMLRDTDAVLAVMEGPDGFLAGVHGAVTWAQMSTIGVHGTERCAELAQQHGVTFVDAPVLGTKQPAERGELVIMASGPEEAREPLEPVFAALGKKTMWVGPAGSGSTLKLVTNSWLVTVVEGTAETVALAEGAGVDPRHFLDAVSGGPLDSQYMRMKAEAMIERDFEPAFKLSLAAKDAGLAEELAQQQGLDLPLVAMIHARLAEAVPQHGDEDVASTYLTSAAAVAQAHAHGSS
ncbi:MAG: 3-hydroxyisobutyrate dehydrogenase [Solirubrobacterales bacterium]|nr:3-hydroxyisobutyrate dehydrogenase [Solirubrobacterales bacterium]